MFMPLLSSRGSSAFRPFATNNKVTRHLGATAGPCLKRCDKPALKSLPHEPYVYAEWKKCRAGLEYHAI